jgi:hypothetical protein
LTPGYIRWSHAQRDRHHDAGHPRLNDQVLRWLVIAFGVAVGVRMLLGA